MTMVYLQQENERALLRHLDQDDAVGSEVNDIVREELEARGWIEAEDDDDDS